MKNVLPVGADLGNDSFKIIGPDKREIFIINLLAPWHERRVVNDDRRYPLNLLEVEITSKEKNLGRHFIGGMAYNFNRGIVKERSVLDRHLGKANDPNILLTLLTSVAVSLIKPNTKIIREKVVLGTMLPTEEYFKNRKENVALFEQKLAGTHRVKFLNHVFNGVEVEFEIVAVNIQPEGLCAMNAIIYDDDGNLLDHYRQNYAERNILGFDIGSLTSDVTVVNNFELRNFFGINKGTIDPLNRIIDYIKTEHQVTISRQKLINTLVNNEKLLVYGENIPDLNDICSEFIVHEGRQLIDEFCSKAAAAGIQLPDIGLMVLCGGGSLMFKEIINLHLPRIPMIFSENAIMLNAIGAWKSANSAVKDFAANTTLDFAAGN
ncbi:MAG TPA: ParM/StbA family protein [Desulfobacteria bacterium]|nr:ParM/StbA family protein [Desulfobacteria bacterium]